jgi:murein DD-endopeptidase MepM/ murein hydrolase activator NlpD
MRIVQMRPPTTRVASITRIVTLALVTAITVVACQDPTGVRSLDRSSERASAHGAFTQSTGVYRIPYSNGTDLTVTRDHHAHTPPDRIDMSAGQGAQVVAAATGVIRAIIDYNGNSPNAGDGVDINGNAQNDALEHSCGNNPPANTVVGQCSDYNNYVWIEHANGEFTKYTHLGTGTVRLAPPNGFGWSVGDTIYAGQVLGLESDIGQATAGDGVSPAFHLHHEVARSSDGLPMLWDSLGGFFQNGVNLVPTVCDIANNLYVSGGDYTAAACLNNAPPVADAGGPYVVDEGTQILLDGTGSDDPDDRPLTYVWTPSTNLSDASLATPAFRAGDDLQSDITLWVFDRVESLHSSATSTITVNNVAPTVTIDGAQVTVIAERGTVTVTADFTDPGWLDTHTASIDWGVPAGHQGEELAAASIQVLTAGGPGVPRTGRVTGTYRYGDNDAGAGYTITVTVADDDGGESSDAFAVTVGNVDPTVSLDPAGTIVLNGVPTVVATAGEPVDFESTTEDPGSDDLTLAWDWADGSSVSRVSLVNPPALDPALSPTVQPRTEVDPRTHTFAQACMYTVEFTATDDDGGSAGSSIAVLITGTSDRVRSTGYWGAEYRLLRNPDHTPEELACFLQIVSHASTVFGEARALGTLAEAVDVLKTEESSSSLDARFDRALLEAWLNFASGSFALDQAVGGHGKSPATTFLALLQEAETLRNDPARTADALQTMLVRLLQLTPGT